ncbi:hypothetical protein DdX_12262 [Ditylenchus destructor]|uniref:FLYWCH-type domain-containing protein n=1 Tax=Ditylenchus destructor TaxID=166010 RepID=A0AAD4MXD7_9BILA|nr:hypothetical protein DdX_12262 [Ditylenchus destructor]
MENRNYNFLDNEKGGLMLSDANGYLYWKHSEKRNTRDETRGYWRCIYCKEGPNGEKESSCKGYGSLFDNIFKVTTNHTHEPYEDVVVLKEFEGRIRQMLRRNQIRMQCAARACSTRAVESDLRFGLSAKN